MKRKFKQSVMVNMCQFHKIKKTNNHLSQHPKKKRRHMKDLDHGLSLPTINVYVKHKFRWMIQGVLAMRTSQRSLLSFKQDTH